MNGQLRALYEDNFPAIVEAISQGAGVSRPLLLQVPDGYTSLPTKLMVVGQQTHGWGEEVSGTADDLLKLYKAFDLGIRYRRTPFWQASHELDRLLNPAGPCRCFLWSNLITVSQNKKRPTLAIEEAVCKLGLLPSEVEITRPDVVVFFTGRGYDERLKAEFPGAAFEQVSPFICRIKHPILPQHSYRTSHPSWLRRKNHWVVLKEIASFVGPFMDAGSA